MSTSIAIRFTEKYYVPSTVLSTLCVTHKLALAIGTCSLQGMSSRRCWLQHLLKRVQGGDQEWGTEKKTGRTGLQMVRYFPEKILWAQFSHFLISRKALKSFMTSNNLLQNISAGLHGLPLHKNHLFSDFPLDSLELFLRATWNAVSQTIDFILPQIKLNSQLSHSALIFSQKCINSFKPLDNLMSNILLELRYWASQAVLVVKNPPANAGDIRDAGGHGDILQYSCLENPMDRGAWPAIVCMVTKSWTRLKRFSMHAIEGNRL